MLQRCSRCILQPQPTWPIMDWLGLVWFLCLMAYQSSWVIQYQKHIAVVLLTHNWDIVRQIVFFSLGYATVLEKKNSEFKTVKLRIEIVLVSHPARVEALGKYILTHSRRIRRFMPFPRVLIQKWMLCHGCDSNSFTTMLQFGALATQVHGDFSWELKDPHHQMVKFHIQDTCWGRFNPLQRCSQIDLFDEKMGP